MASVERLIVVLSSVIRLRKLHEAQKGISFLDFAQLCTLPGIDNAVVNALLVPVTCLRDASLTVDQGAQCVRTILQTLVEKKDCFTTLDHFIWLIRATIAAQLIEPLAHKAVQYIPLLSKLFAVIRCLNQTTCTNTATVISALTRSLKDDIPLPPNGLVSIIYRLSLVNCSLFYYTAVALILTELEEILHPGLITYRMQGMGDIIESLFAFDLMYRQPNSETMDSTILYRVVLLLHLYQLVVIESQINKSEQELAAEHGTYAEHFRIEYKYMETIWSWLYSVFPSMPTQGLTTPLDELVHCHVIPLAATQHERSFVKCITNMGSIIIL